MWEINVARFKRKCIFGGRECDYDVDLKLNK